MNILLVDDEPQLIYQILSDCGGYSVNIARDGRQAIRQIMQQQNSFDLIILDLQMPYMNGWQTLQFIRNHTLTKDIYIILLTSHTEETLLIRGLQRGADEYLMKPLSPSRLLAHIEAIERRLTGTITANLPKTNMLEMEELRKLLTQREKEILTHIVQGSSNQDIAKKLVISEITVRNHLANIYRKLQVSNRNQAAFIAQKLQMV